MHGWDHSEERKKMVQMAQYLLAMSKNLLFYRIEKSHQLEF